MVKRGDALREGAPHAGSTSINMLPWMAPRGRSARALACALRAGWASPEMESQHACLPVRGHTCGTAARLLEHLNTFTALRQFKGACLRRRYRRGQLPSEVTHARPQRKDPFVQTEVHKHNGAGVKSVDAGILRNVAFGGIPELSQVKIKILTVLDPSQA